MAAVAATGKSHPGCEVKTQFCTKEGFYRSLKLSDYSRPSRLATNSPNNVPVRLSFVSLKLRPDSNEEEEKVAFNVGRDIYFFPFYGTKKAPDLNQPIDRRTYKGAQPTCHDINMATTTCNSLDLIIGFTAGQIQLIDPLSRERQKCFNDERLIEKAPVTCVKWIPSSVSKFLVSYTNPNLYTYDINLPSLISEPALATIKTGNGFSIEINKKEQSCNPICRWKVGQSGINQMSFSPCNKYLALVSQDGYLRIFDYYERELIGTMRSYFGGLICCCWSPDSKYIVTGGEDDLITIYSRIEQRVIARGEGHQSWVNVVSFDPYTCNIQKNITEHNSHNSSLNEDIISYRVGSVGDDTRLLLWDIGDDILRPQKIRTRSRAPTVSVASNANMNPSWTFNSNTFTRPSTLNNDYSRQFSTSHGDVSKTVGPHTSRYHTINKITTRHHNSISNYTGTVVELDDLILGSLICPRMCESEKLEPLISKKIALDRISALEFKKDCIVTATYEGYINVWARPEKQEPATQSKLSNSSSSTLIQ